MKVVLRLIALFQGVLGLALLLMPLLLAMAGRVPATERAWLAMSLTAGPIGLFSGVQLLRFRESGRRAALAFIAVVILFGMVHLRSTAKWTVGTAVRLGIAAGMVAVLLSERARQLCGEPVARPEPATNQHTDAPL